MSANRDGNRQPIRSEDRLPQARRAQLRTFKSISQPTSCPRFRKTGTETETGPRKLSRGLTPWKIGAQIPIVPHRKRYLVEQATVLGNGAQPTEERENDNVPYHSLLGLATLNGVFGGHLSEMATIRQSDTKGVYRN